ncbi:MAG: carbohydrate kinase family protein [Calditrichia bacterium]
MNNKNLDVVVVGELNIDLVLWNVPMPEDEKEKLAEDMRFTMGSSSAITAHNLSAIGSRVGFVGKAGKDAFGNYMKSELSAAGVDTSRIMQEEDLKTGATIVLANPPKKALLTYMGAMTDLTIEDMDWDYLKTAKHLHLGCFYLQTGIRDDVDRLFARAKEMGLTTSLDTNWDPDEKWDESIYNVLKQTDIFFPNDDEAIRIAHAGNLDEAVDKLAQMAGIVVVKRGKEGALLKTGQSVLEQKPFNVNAVETTGAGDSFNAGFLHQYLRDGDLKRSLRYGNACGALAVTEMGGTAAFRNSPKMKKKMGNWLSE